MRKFAFILAALPVWGLSNSVRVTETTGAGQTNHPVTISRYFSKGEIPSSYACVQPFVDGVAAEAWQCEKKNTHSDGSLKWAIVALKIPSLTANATVEIDFRPSALTASGAGHAKADVLADSGWNADMRFVFNTGTADEWNYTLDARTMLAALAENAVCADVADTTLRGLRTWINGPVATQWIVEDKCRTRAYDFGATAVAGQTAWATWSNDSYRTLHPWFVLTAYWDYPSAGQVTVAVDYVVEQPWRTIYQNVKYRPRFRDQNLTHVVEERTVADFDHWRQKTYFFRGWASTTSVPRTQIDHNLPYMIYSGVVPPLEMRPTGANDKLFENSTVDTILNFYRAQYASTYAGEAEPFQYARGSAVCQPPYQTAYLCAGIWNKNWQMSGMSTTYLLIPEAYVQWLYVMGSPHVTLARKLAYWDELVVGTADIAGSTFGMSLLENVATTQKFCDQWCTTPTHQTQLAWGQPVSMAAYPAMNGLENAIGNWTSNGNRCPFTFLPATGGAIDETTTTITVQNASTFTVPAYLQINEAEVVYCTTKVGNVFSNCARGQVGTTAVSASSNRSVSQWPCAAKKYDYNSMIDGVSPMAHAQAPWFIPALLTGHPYYHEQLMREGMAMAAIGNAAGSSIMSSRNGSDLWYPFQEYRGRPQGMKIFVQAWALSFGPIQEYLDYFLRRQVAIEEGRLNVAQGEASFYSGVAGSPYQKGATVYLSGWGTVPGVTANPTNYAMTMPYATTGAYTSSSYPVMADLTLIHTLASWWMMDYSNRTNAYAISLGLDYFRPMARATNRVFQRSIQLAPFAIGDYTLAGSFLKPSVRKEVLSATHDAGRNKLVLNFAAPHGFSGTYSNATFCCPDPLWTGGWQTKAITAFGSTMTVVDSDTVEIPWTTAMTGTYNSDGSGCCSTARQKLHFSAFNSGDTNAFQGPPQSWAEFDSLWPIEARTLNALHSTYEATPLGDRVAHFYATTMWLASLGLWDKTLAPDLMKNYQKFRSVKRYWDRQFAVVGACGFSSCGSPGVAFGWKEQIANLTAVPSHDKVLIRFQAPTADPARVAITTGDLFLDSRDAADTVATCQGRDCYAILPASASTTYRYRVTGGTNGVARLEGYVQTLDGAGEASSYRLTLHAPQGRGITQVMVQNGLTDAYGASQTVACTSSCLVTVSGYAGELHYVQWTWQTTVGVQVGQQGERIFRIE